MNDTLSDGGDDGQGAAPSAGRHSTGGSTVAGGATIGGGALGGDGGSSDGGSNDGPAPTIGGTGNEVVGVSGSGGMEGGAGGSDPGPGSPCGCRSSESLTLLGCDPGSALAPFSSADGRALAYSFCPNTGGCESFYFSDATGVLPLPQIDGSSVVAGLSDDGTRVLLQPGGERDSAHLYDVTDQRLTPVDVYASMLLFSAEGVVFGVTERAGGKTELRRVVDGAVETLGELPVRFDSVWLGSSTPDGSLVVGSITGAQSEPFRWSEATGIVIGLSGVPAGTAASLDAVSRDGSTLGGYKRDSGDTGRGTLFIWTEADGITELGASEPAQNVKVLLSDDGSVAAGQVSDRAFRWTQGGGAESLLPNAPRRISVMDPTGSVILGERTSGPGNTAAFVWTVDQGERSLAALLADQDVDLTQLRFGAATSLSRDGKIAVGAATCNDRSMIYRLEIPE